MYHNQRLYASVFVWHQNIISPKVDDWYMIEKQKSVLASIRNTKTPPDMTSHDIMALERFARDTRHMIVFDIYTWDCPAGDKDQRIRIFPTDESYQQALRSQECGEMKIKKNAHISKGHLSFDKPERSEI